jgi:hypothetical protein
MIPWAHTSNFLGVAYVLWETATIAEGPMSAVLISAIKNEIENLEASIFQDIRWIRARELRKILELYKDKDGTTENDGASQSVARTPPPGRRNVEVDPKSGVTSPRMPGGRRPSPEREQAIELAKTFLSGKTVPTPTRDILTHIQSEGHSVPGEVPVNNLSAMLSNADDFKSHGRSGWTLAEVELREVANDYSTDLDVDAILATIIAWDSNKRIPSEIDSVLLVRARDKLDRDLREDERANLRFDFVEALRQIPTGDEEVGEQ